MTRESGGTRTSCARLPHFVPSTATRGQPWRRGPAWRVHSASRGLGDVCGRLMAVKGHFVITGCAGFIGSHLTDRLLAHGHTVVGIDSFADYYPRTVKEANLEGARVNPAFTLHEANILKMAAEAAPGGPMTPFIDRFRIRAETESRRELACRVGATTVAGRGTEAGGSGD